MFRRNIDQFRFENGPHRFNGQGPTEPHGHPPPLPFGGPPHFGSIPPFPGPHPRPPIPMGRESFQEIRDYMLLLIIAEYKEGITGYQLQEKYNFPRGTLIRTLQDLEEKGYLETREEIIEGRANKFYLITEEGKKFLEELKLKWASIFGMLAEINPGKGLKHMLDTKIEEFESLEDAVDFFRGIRSWSKGMLKNIERKIEKFKKSNANLNEIINELEKMDTLDKNKIRKMVMDGIKQLEEEKFDVE